MENVWFAAKVKLPDIKWTSRGEEPNTAETSMASSETEAS